MLTFQVVSLMFWNVNVPRCKVSTNIEHQHSISVRCMYAAYLILGSKVSSGVTWSYQLLLLHFCCMITGSSIVRIQRRYRKGKDNAGGELVHSKQLHIGRLTPRRVQVLSLFFDTALWGQRFHFPRYSKTANILKGLVVGGLQFVILEVHDVEMMWRS